MNFKLDSFFSSFDLEIYTKILTSSNWKLTAAVRSVTLIQLRADS